MQSYEYGVLDSLVLSQINIEAIDEYGNYLRTNICDVQVVKSNKLYTISIVGVLFNI